MSNNDLVQSATQQSTKCGSATGTVALSFAQRLAQIQQSFLQAGTQGLSLELPRSFWNSAQDLCSHQALPAASKDSHASAFSVPPKGLDSSQIVARLATFFAGKHLPAHPSAPVNVLPYPTQASILAALLPAIQGPNLCSDESGSPYVQAEQSLAQELAARVKWDKEHVKGIFTFSGTGTLLYAMRIALEKLFPGSLYSGLPRKAAILCSSQAHHACTRVAGWLGLGQNSVIKIPTDANANMDIIALEKAMRKLSGERTEIAAIVATVGTTDAFGMDSLKQIHALREQLQQELQWQTLPYLHADAVISWPWLFFSTYDFTQNKLGIPQQTLPSLQKLTDAVGQLHFGDSFGVDFHKTGFAPNTSSLLVLKQQSDLSGLRCQPADAPYFLNDQGEEPGSYTLETSRSGNGPLSAWASLWQLGEEGFQVLMAHALDMAHSLRKALANVSDVQVLYPENEGPSVLVRVFPSEIGQEKKDQQQLLTTAECQQIDELNRKVADHSLASAREGNGACWGSTIAPLFYASESRASTSTRVLKAFCMSPQMNATHVAALVEAIHRFR